MTRHTSDGALLRELGVWGLAASIVNITIGGGIFRLPAAAAQDLGAAAPIAFIVCAVAMGLIVLCFAEAGSRVSLTGGVYAYVEVAFGPFVGFLTGVMLWSGTTVATAAVASFFGDALVALIPSLSGARVPLIVVIIIALSALNIAGLRGASRFNAVTTVAKLIPLLLFIAAGLFAIHGENLRWGALPEFSRISRASTVIIFAFLGIESALVPGAEVRDPARTVPRAIFIAMLAITAIYLVIQVVAQGTLGAALAGQKTPVAEAAAVSMGNVGRTLILVGMAISMFGYVSGMMLAVPRALYAFGRDGFLPAIVGSVHDRFRSPHVAIGLQGIIVILLATTGSFETLAVIANGSILLVYAAAALAVIQLRRMGVAQGGTPFRMPLASVIPILGFLVIAWLLTSLSRVEWSWLMGIVIVAAIIFVATIASRRGRPALAESAR